MAGRFILLVLSLAFYSAQAQFIALPGSTLTTTRGANIVINTAGNVNLGDNNFDLGNASVVIALKGAATLTHTHVDPVLNIGLLQIDSLRMDGGNGKLQNTWVVAKGITLKNGKLLVNPFAPDNARLVYTGNDLGSSAGNPNSYVMGRMFVKGSSTRTFPIGNANGFYPAQLNGVSDANALTRMECLGGTPPMTLSELTAKFEDIEDLVVDRYYELKVFNLTSFSGSPISLSLNGTSPTIDPSKNKPVVVELDSLSSIRDLQGSPGPLFLLSGSNTTAKGGKYMIAASKDVTIKIHRLITPNGDGENDALVIEGIDLYPNNKVTLLDRWGGVYLTKVGFSGGQTDIDYTKLVNGNYICVVEYTDASGTHKPKPQMITVLK